MTAAQSQLVGDEGERRSGLRPSSFLPFLYPTHYGTTLQAALPLRAAQDGKGRIQAGTTRLGRGLATCAHAPLLAVVPSENLLAAAAPSAKPVGVSAVCVAVSPVSVMRDPTAMSAEAWMVTVNVLVTSDSGDEWPIVLESNAGTTTSSGLDDATAGVGGAARRW